MHLHRNHSKLYIVVKRNKNMFWLKNIVIKHGKSAAGKNGREHIFFFVKLQFQDTAILQPAVKPCISCEGVDFVRLNRQ